MPRCPQCEKFFRSKKALIKHNAEAHTKKIPHIGRTRNIV
jgi:uncharacterized C2H2 Zn-finger protein